MRKECYTAPITAEEKARFVPFMHMLIDTAFDVIVPRFLTGLVSKDKAAVPSPKPTNSLKKKCGG